MGVRITDRTTAEAKLDDEQKYGGRERGGSLLMARKAASAPR
jgi:hypothetical protein